MVYRPEVGAYLNNQQAVANLQFHSLHERQNQAPGMVDQGQGDAPGWVRVASTNSQREGVQSSDDTSYLVHAGSDVLRVSDGADGSIRLGVMGAYGKSDNQADNGRLSASGNVDGYSVGLYGTWYGNQDILSGPYVDSWVMHGWFDNTVKGQGLPTEDYKSRNLAGSLEAGYSFPVYENARQRMFIEPQGQVIVSDYRADRHTEGNGTTVSGQSGSSVITRLGLRAHAELQLDSSTQPLRPFAEVNWWHGPDSQSATFDGVTVRDELPGDRLEAKLGLQGNVTNAVSVWSSLGFEAGADDYSAVKSQVGVKYAW
nr:outer membrane autotransporter barrel domain-containing protein [Pseudomonas plecoglossicida NB2011]